MLQIRVQGRGGQGAQRAGEVLAATFFREGKFVQAFASYGGARRGAPVSSFIKVDDTFIRQRCNIEHPDAILCFDSSLMDNTLLAGASKDTLILVNSSKPAEAFKDLGDLKIVTVDGIALAQKNNLGRIVNTALLGAFAGLVQTPNIEVLKKVVEEMSPVKVPQNVSSCLDGYELARKKREGLA